MRKSTLLVLASLAGCLACASVPPPPSTPLTASPEMARYLAQRTVVVRSGPMTCSGVIVRGYILTCAHCRLNGEFEVTYVTRETVKAKDIYRDEVGDLMVLNPERPAPDHYTPLAMAIHWGERVHAMGHPLLRAFSYSQGYVSFPRRTLTGGVRDGFTGTQIYMNTFQGASGGPVVNDLGELVGLTSSVINGTGVTDVVHVQTMRDALSVLR